MRENRHPLFLLACASLLALSVACLPPVQAASSTGTVFGVVHLVAFNVSVSAISDTSVSITWDTNSGANGTVEYGTATSYGSIRTDSAVVKKRTIILDGLSPGTTYHYRVVSADPFNRVYRSGDLQFTTTGKQPGPRGGGGGRSSADFELQPVIQPVVYPPREDCKVTSSGVGTPATGAGILPSCIFTSSVRGMTDVRSSWWVMIREEPLSGAEYYTYIRSEPTPSTLAAFNEALGASGLRMTALAYLVKVTESVPITNGGAIIEMDVSTRWVGENGGVDAVRIIREGDDGRVQILETRFMNYVLDSGHMNFRAVSPEGLSIFAIIAVEAAPVPVTETPATTPATVVPTETVTQVTPCPMICPLAIILLLVILGILIWVLVRRNRKSL